MCAPDVSSCMFRQRCAVETARLQNDRFRVALLKIIFETQGDLHELVVKVAFRLVGNKLPGTFSNTKFLLNIARNY